MTTSPVYHLDPLTDPRWEPFVRAHSSGSVFHSPEWLRALQLTYGYVPAAVTTSRPGEELTNAIVFCRVNSWLTGRRSVSLPFSDHCEPLTDRDGQFESLLAGLESDRRTNKGKYFEIRPLDLQARSRSSVDAGEVFCLHRLDLHPSTQELYKQLHKDCIQRKIKRAHKEGLTYETGRSDVLLDQFYKLLMLTRQRLRLPPQPIAWFHNLIACMQDNLMIRVASTNGRPVASILTLRYKGTLTYKYGCMDKEFANLGGMQLLFWKAIEEAKEDGLVDFDFGRCELSNHGLMDFKRRWGAVESESAYLRGPAGQGQAGPVAGLLARCAREVLARAPSRFMFTANGLYRHFG